MKRLKKSWKLFPIKKPVRHKGYQDVGYGLLFKDFQIEFVELYYQGRRTVIKPLAWFEIEDIDKIMKTVSSLKKFLEKRWKNEENM